MFYTDLTKFHFRLINKFSNQNAGETENKVVIISNPYLDATISMLQMNHV